MQRGNASPNDVRRDAPARRFHFRQFRHYRCFEYGCAGVLSRRKMPSRRPVCCIARYSLTSTARQAFDDPFRIVHRSRIDRDFLTRNQGGRLPSVCALPHPAAIRVTLVAAAIATILVVADPASVHAQSIGPGVVPHATPVPRSADENAGLSPDVFYRLLLGDVALQRGETS